MRKIRLTRGQITIVDNDDFDGLNRFKWYADKNQRGKFYAVRMIACAGRQKKIRMHRVLLGAPSRLVVDHVDGNTLDNRRTNLRLATKQQNSFNKKHPMENNRLGVKGVYWHKETKKYKSSIRCNGKAIHLGLFELLTDADMAYRDAEVKYFGEFSAKSSRRGPKTPRKEVIT